MYFIYHSRAYSKIYFHTLKKISVTSEDRYLWNNTCNLHESFCTCHLLLWLCHLLLWLCHLLLWLYHLLLWLSPVAVAVSPIAEAVSPVAVAMSPVAVACSSSVHITCCCGLLLLCTYHLLLWLASSLAVFQRIMCFWFRRWRLIFLPSHGAGSVVAGPLAAQGGGQICRPFVLGFGNWRVCLKYKSHVMSTVTLWYEITMWI